MFDATTLASGNCTGFTPQSRTAPATARFLVVEDDPVVSRVLTRSLRARGYAVDLAVSADQALAIAQAAAPDYVILELKVAGASTLPLIAPLRTAAPSALICLYTAYASIESAVEAIKLGACYYLAKPAPLDEILLRLNLVSPPRTEPKGRRQGTSRSSRRQPAIVEQYRLNDIEWRHIMHTLRECGGNISEASRRLKMHRRTLDRKFAARGGTEASAVLARLRASARDQRVSCA
jgi:two-component system response regulator RegA